MSQSTSLAGKTALVTGAATGIGKAIAGALAAAGARVVVNHRTPHSRPPRWSPTSPRPAGWPWPWLPTAAAAPSTRPWSGGCWASTAAGMCWSTEVDWTGSIARGAGRASGGSGALRDLPITVASRFGEPEGKTSPKELIAACFATALGSILAARRTPPEQLRVTATVTLETSETPTIASRQLAAHGVVPGADPAAFDQAAQQAERSCPVSRALQRNVEIGVHATLEGPPASSRISAA